MSYQHYETSKYSGVGGNKSAKTRVRSQLKKAKSKACRLAAKRVVEQYLKGDENRALSITTNPKQGWFD